jgi:hypothetical protein
MTLQTKLAELKKKSAGVIPPDALEIMGSATAALENSDILEKVLKAKDKAPEFTLPDTNGTAVSSKALLEKGPLVVCFYRGVW